MAKKKILNASEMGRKGGARRTPAKLAAARANGAKGGRPPKFDVGDRARALEVAPLAVRGQTGTVVEIGPARAQFCVRFPGAKAPRRMWSWWLDRL